ALSVAMGWYYSGASKGYMGFPSRASAEFGAAVRQAATGILVEMLEDSLLKGKTPKAGPGMYLALKILTNKRLFTLFEKRK
ncbi:MAG: hypothetical protein AB1742_02060, partial [bacterium]